MHTKLKLKGVDGRAPQPEADWDQKASAIFHTKNPKFLQKAHF
jgi:hypothetical protein